MFEYMLEAMKKEFDDDEYDVVDWVGRDVDIELDNGFVITHVSLRTFGPNNQYDLIIDTNIEEYRGDTLKGDLSFEETLDVKAKQTVQELNEALLDLISQAEKYGKCDDCERDVEETFDHNGGTLCCKCKSKAVWESRKRPAIKSANKV